MPGAPTFRLSTKATAFVNLLKVLIHAQQRILNALHGLVSSNSPCSRMAANNHWGIGAAHPSVVFCPANEAVKRRWDCCIMARAAASCRASPKPKLMAMAVLT